MPIERELKFLLDAPEALDPEAIAAALDGAFRVEPLRTVRHADRYFDDPRLSLARAGVALRRRIGGGTIVATLKTQGRVTGAMHERDEVELPMEGRAWPEPIYDRIARLVDVEALAGRWELEVERRRFRVRADLGRSDAAELAEVSVDAVEATRPSGGRTVRFAEVEIEDRGGGAAALERIAERLGRVATLTPSVETKLERARRMLLGDADG